MCLTILIHCKRYSLISTLIPAQISQNMWALSNFVMMELLLGVGGGLTNCSRSFADDDYLDLANHCFLFNKQEENNVDLLRIFFFTLPDL